jgi:hypothetical protein
MTQNPNTAEMNRNSAITSYSVAAESVLSDPTENVVFSHETPIIVQNTNVPRGQEPMLKTWAKYLLPILIVLGLAFVMAIVLVVLAVMGYLGKGKAEEIQIVPETGTATTTAAGAPAITHWVVKTSAGLRRRAVGMMFGEMVLGWVLVHLFGI